MPLTSCKLCSIVVLLSYQCNQHVASAFAPPSHNIQHTKPTHQKDITTTLYATNEKPKSARERGIYSRPSAAIERGSGFFIPGLEGPRIRILFGTTVLIADVANHFFAESAVGDYGQLVAEVLAAVYGAFLLLQGLIESGVGSRSAIAAAAESEELIVEQSEGEEGASTSSVVGNSNGGFSSLVEGNVSVMKSMQRLAQTIVSLTPATHFVIANEQDGILYRYGNWDNNDNLSNDDDDTTIIKLALDAMGSSRAGRVALPSEHPASKLLPTSATRCILVQSIEGYGSGGKTCLIIGSDKLLPAYTKNDLRWIGQLAIEPNV